MPLRGKSFQGPCCVFWGPAGGTPSADPPSSSPLVKVGAGPCYHFHNQHVARDRRPTAATRRSLVTT